MERIAIIDLGSNSIRFLIKEINADSTFKLIFKDKKSIRLAEGMGKKLILTEAAIKKAVNCLKIYSNFIEFYNVDKIFAIATAAVRNASNKKYFLERIKEETGIKLNVIDGKKEAYLGFSGVIHTINKTDFLMFDLGGASIEISLIKNKKIINSISLPLGAVNLTEKFNLKKEISSKKIESIKKYIQNQIKSIEWLPKEEIPLIGIGGTVRSLAKIHQRQINYPFKKLHNYTLPLSSISKIFEIIYSQASQKRKNIPGLSEDRSDIILAGAIVINELLNSLSSKTLTISISGLREGIFFNYYHSLNFHKKYNSDSMLINSVLNYKKMLIANNVDYSNNITEIALLLFDKLKDIHKLTQNARLLLRCASILHNIGLKVNYFKSEKHTAYIILNASIYGWSHIDQIKTAFIASFHNGFSNKIIKNSSYITLLNNKEIREIKILSFILHISEIFNFYKNISPKNIHISETEKNVILHIGINKKDIHIIDYYTQSILHYFCKLFSKKLLIKHYIINK